MDGVRNALNNTCSIYKQQQRQQKQQQTQDQQLANNNTPLMRKIIIQGWNIEPSRVTSRSGYDTRAHTHTHTQRESWIFIRFSFDLFLLFFLNPQSSTTVFKVYRISVEGAPITFADKIIVPARRGPSFLPPSSVTALIRHVTGQRGSSHIL